MQASQWTTDIIVISTVLAVASALLGYFAAALRQGRQLSQLTAQLEQSHTAQASVIAEKAALTEQLKVAEGRGHELQVAESKLNAQLQSAIENVTRLNTEQQQSRDVIAAVQLKLEDASRQHHEAAKRLDTVQAEGRAFQERVTDLRDRLEKAQTSNDQLQADRDRLKDELANEGKRAKSLETSERDVREQLSEAKQALTERAQVLNALQERFGGLSSEHTELKTTLQKREEHFQEQMLQLADTRKSLTQEFENLANKIFEEKGKTFTQTSQTSIDGMLKPFRDQIEGFQKRINDVHDASLQGNTSLNAEIKKVLDIGLKMSSEANNLTSALKGDSQQRGAWGEAQLRRTLEMSGAGRGGALRSAERVQGF